MLSRSLLALSTHRATQLQKALTRTWNGKHFSINSIPMIYQTGRSVHTARELQQESTPQTSDSQSTNANAEQAATGENEPQAIQQQRGGATQVHRGGRRGRGRRERNVGDEFDAFRSTVGQMMDDFDQSMFGGRGHRFGGMDMGRNRGGMFGLLPFPLQSFPFGGRVDRALLPSSFTSGDRVNSMLTDTAEDMEDDTISDALALPSSTPFDLLRSPNVTPMKIDVEEEKDKYIVTAEAPGFKKEDLHVRVENGMLVISGERSEEKKHEDKNRRMLRSERTMSSVRRVIALSSDTDQSPEKVKAHYDHGLLKIEIPKTHPSDHAGRVHITSGEDASAMASQMGTEGKAPSDKVDAKATDR